MDYARVMLSLNEQQDLQYFKYHNISLSVKKELCVEEQDY